MTILERERDYGYGHGERVGVPYNPCDMCQYYSMPGWVINAWQIVPCWQCNQDNKRNLPKPKSLAETEAGQLRDRRLYDPHHA